MKVVSSSENCSLRSKSVKWRLVKKTTFFSWNWVNVSNWIWFRAEEIIAEHKLKNGHRFLGKRSDAKESFSHRVIAVTADHFAFVRVLDEDFLDEFVVRRAKSTGRFCSAARTRQIDEKTSRSFLLVSLGDLFFVQRLQNALKPLRTRFASQFDDRSNVFEELRRVLNDVHRVLLDQLLEISQRQVHSTGRRRRTDRRATRRRRGSLLEERRQKFQPLKFF